MERKQILQNEYQAIEDAVTAGAGEWLALRDAWRAVLSIEQGRVIGRDEWTANPVLSFAAIRPLNDLLNRAQGPAPAMRKTTPDGHIPAEWVQPDREPGPYWNGERVNKAVLQSLINDKVSARLSLESGLNMSLELEPKSKPKKRTSWERTPAFDYVVEAWTKLEGYKTTKVFWSHLLSLAKSDGNSPFKGETRELVIKATGKPLTRKTLENAMPKIRNSDKPTP
jgi:hypothetical protein